MKQNADIVRVLFPLGTLKTDGSLLDPHDTHTIWEYYLLENLSCGLVRDSLNTTSGYEGCLAEKFFQPSPEKWVFILKPLKWSNGDVVTEGEIRFWLNDLWKTNRRHIRYLKVAKTVTYDPTTRAITIEFPSPVGSILLHELNLADASFALPPKLSNNWAKVLGPYSVKKQDFTNNRVVLISNPLSPLFREAMPKEIELFLEPDPAARNQLFIKGAVDIVPVSAFTNRARSKPLIDSAPSVFWGHPTNLLYFVVNRKSPLAISVDVRRTFAKLIGRARVKLSPMALNDGALSAANQMIPQGFHGSLSSQPTIEASEGAIKGKHFTLRLPTVLESYPEITTAMTEEFALAKAELHIEFSDAEMGSDDQIFAQLNSFVGNQQNASGSWSFLFSPENGPLRDWQAQFKTTVDAIFSPSPAAELENRMLDLHSKILSEAIAVPFLIGKQRYLLGKSLDATNWNPFDSRLRFYELKRK